MAEDDLTVYCDNSICSYMVRYSGIELTMLIPFSGGKYLNIGWLAIPLLYFAVIGTVNGVNFTDGVDGLVSSVTIMVATFFSVVAIGTNAGIAPITCAVAGALLGFLLFNVYPASVFMGDTGSLALGGFVVATAYMLQMPLYILIVGLIYLAEVISVMVQVPILNTRRKKQVLENEFSEWLRYIIISNLAAGQRQELLRYLQL